MDPKTGQIHEIPAGQPIPEGWIKLNRKQRRAHVARTRSEARRVAKTKARKV